jgi:hypothetical protein
MSSNVETESKLPTIPKEWNLTEAQRASMIATQKKNMALNKDQRVKRRQLLDNIMQHAKMTPPVYPILVVVKEKNVTVGVKKYYLTDSNKNYLYASSFDDATNKVKNDLASSNSQLQKEYASNTSNASKLRISSDNIKGPTKLGKIDLIENGNYKLWEIITTNAAPSFLSKFRQSMWKGGKTQRKKNKKNKKTKTKKTKTRTRKHMVK